jgi:ketosteroid isomerase-like protein
MKKLSILLISCVAALSFQCNNPKVKLNVVDPEANQEALMQADRDWSDAASSAEGHVSFFLDDALVLGANQPIVEGKESIAQMLGQFHSMPGFAIKWNATKAVVAESGELGYTYGAYEFSVSDSTGAPMNEIGKYLTIWNKDADGNWKVKADMFSSDSPEH